MQLTIQAITTHLDAIDDALSQLTERMADLTEPMLGIGMLLETSISERIRNSKQSPDGDARRLIERHHIGCGQPQRHRRQR